MNVNELFEQQIQSAKNSIVEASMFLRVAAELAVTDNDAEKLARCLTAESSLTYLLERLDTGFEDHLETHNYNDVHTACDMCEAKDPYNCHDCTDWL